MDEEIRKEIINAMNKAIKSFKEELKDWNFPYPIKIEVREHREGDGSLGESIIIDEIKEYEENLKNDNKN